MSQMNLVFCFRGEKHHVGLVHLKDFTIDRIRVDALKITSVYGLDEARKILLNLIIQRTK